MATKKKLAFDPDWVVAPGETLREWMDDNGLFHLGRDHGAGPMAVMCGLTPEVIEGVLAGTTEITEGIALGLQRGTQIPRYMWLNLERFYREGLRQGKKPL